MSFVVPFAIVFTLVKYSKYEPGVSFHWVAHYSLYIRSPIGLFAVFLVLPGTPNVLTQNELPKMFKFYLHLMSD